MFSSDEEEMRRISSFFSFRHKENKREAQLKY
jgi:hypothetical protein